MQGPLQAPESKAGVVDKGRLWESTNRQKHNSSRSLPAPVCGSHTHTHTHTRGSAVQIDALLKIGW